MLERKNRLVSKKDFARVYKIGKFQKLGGISLKYAKNNLEISRVGVSVGVKFSKKAVARNKEKRIIREFFRLMIPSLESGYDLVVMAHGNGDDHPKILEKILKRANLLKK